MALLLRAQAAQDKSAVTPTVGLFGNSLEHRAGNRFAFHIENAALDDHAFAEEKVLSCQRFSNPDLDLRKSDSSANRRLTAWVGSRPPSRRSTARPCRAAPQCENCRRASFPSAQLNVSAFGSDKQYLRRERELVGRSLSRSSPVITEPRSRVTLSYRIGMPPRFPRQPHWRDSRPLPGVRRTGCTSQHRVAPWNNGPGCR